MTESPRVPDPDADGVPREDLLAEAIRCWEAGERENLGRLLKGHSDQAEEIEAMLRWLAESDLAGDESAGPDKRIGEFDLLRPIGEGGMGRVYLARQRSLGRLVALKVLRSSTPELAARFRREAEVLARVRHPSVVTVHAFGDVDGQSYLAMDWVPGDSLEDRLGQARPAIADVVRWLRDVSQALAAVHAVGVVHRDVKPDNIRIDEDGRAVLVDFGLAKDLVDPSWTRSGTFHGSPQYAAPEQVAIERREIGPATDVFAVGATLYRCLGGRPPFDGRTSEQLFHQILVTEPTPLRRVAPDVPRDLEAIVHQALEKSPAHRYRSAVDLARDLDAVLELRPVRAQPPSRVRSLVRWARRNRAFAATVAFALVALLGVPIALWVQAESDHARARQRATELVGEAKRLLAEYRSDRERTSELEQEIPSLRREREVRYLTPTEEARLDQREGELEILVQRRQLVVAEVLARLDQAARLDSALDVEATRRELFLTKLEEAELGGETGVAEFFRDLLRVGAGDRPLDEELAGVGEVELTSDPPGARVYLFRYRIHADVVDGGEQRLVPVPAFGQGLITPGAPCLRVVRGAGEVPVGSLVVNAQRVVIGAQHTVLIDGRLVDRVLPDRVEVVRTRAPLSIDAGSLVGTTPYRGRLTAGSYVAVLRASDREDLRCPLSIGRGDVQRHHADLLPAGMTPPGFVYLPPCGSTDRGSSAPAAPPRTDGIWLQRREVTCREYLEFLNSPEVLAEIAAAAEPILVPRASLQQGRKLEWRRSAAQRYALPAGVDPRAPVLGISCRDAMRYATWRTSRAERDGLGIAFTLPSVWDWQWAAFGPGGRRYVYGNRFRPKWIKSLYARRDPSPEPVLSYPIDESPFGVFDLCGSAAEHCGNWFWPEKKWRTRVGGSWGNSREKVFRVLYQEGRHEHSVTSGIGFRLAARRVQ